MEEVLLSFFFVCKTAVALLSIPINPPVKYLASNGATGRVYVSTGSTVYSLSQNLQQLDEISFGANQGGVSGMALTDNGNWLVICLKDRSCRVIDASSTMNSSTNNSVENAIAGGTEGVAMFTDFNNSFYTGGVGSTLSGESVLNNRHVFGQFGFAGSTVSRLNQQPSAAGTRVMYSGFYRSPYAYYLAVDDDREIRIVRVCNDNATESSQFSAVYELELECGLASSVQLAGVSLVNSVTVVLGVVHDSFVNSPGALCSYNLSAINEVMDQFFDDCLVDSESYTNNVDSYSGSVYDSPCSTYNKPVIA